MAISFYELYYPETDFDYSGNTQICCPFTHSLNNETYYETNPSAGIDISKGLFHCFTCGRGYNEIQFAEQILNCDYAHARKFVQFLQTINYDDTKNWQYAIKNFEANDSIKLLVEKLDIGDNVIKDLKLGYTGGGLAIPIFINNYLLDVVTYRPKEIPKYVRRTNSISGLICPFDIWTKNKNDTIICAGEKDMLTLRTVGLNGISITGGEVNSNILFINEFNDRNIYICFDNDDAGRNGSIKLAQKLIPYCKNVYLTDISNVCINKGEDIYDFFRTYNRTKEDFIKILKQSKLITNEYIKEIMEKQQPIISLYEATKPANLNKTVRSIVQVVATTDATFKLPKVILGTKGKTTKESDTLLPGDERVWELNDTNLNEIFNLIDSNLKETTIDSYIKTNLLKIPLKEPSIKIKKLNNESVYKCVVTDVLNAMDNSIMTEFTTYTINNKLENGKKYTITYKLVPNPQDGQKLTMVILDSCETNSFIDSFKIDDNIKKSLRKFQPNLEQPFEEKFTNTTQRIKGLLNADYNNTLITLIDLWYHSALQFTLNDQVIRGYLDMLIIGESRIGKSTTVEALQKVYKVGKIVSLAGSSATIAGLIGGSNKVNGSYQTRAGIIPQNNKEGLIFEELIKCNSNLIKELTDIRSSNKVRIARVNGSIELPANVRMLTLTNNKTIDGYPKPISEYPNGIKVITDIIGTSEDIARYDAIAVFGFNVSHIDPNFIPLTPYPDIDYQNRIQWVWSRKAENIIIPRPIWVYTINECEKINKIYNSHIRLFGIEAWKKVLRMAIAIAGYMCSTDITFENIIVEKIHINKAVEILVSLYDNDVFRFKEYVEDERKTEDFTETDVKNLQEYYTKYFEVIDIINKQSQISRQQLASMTNIDRTSFDRCIYLLTKSYFIVNKGYDVSPTLKFKKTFRKIDKTIINPNELGGILNLDKL